MSNESVGSNPSNADRLQGLQQSNQQPSPSTQGAPPWESKPSSPPPETRDQTAGQGNAATPGQLVGSQQAWDSAQVAGVKPRNGKGVGALVCGLLGLFPFPITGFWLSLVAIIIGWQGYKRAERGEATNSGVALTGFILGIIGMGVQAFVGLGLWLSSG